MTEKKRMLAGMLYCQDDQLREELHRARRLLRRFNDTTEEQMEERADILVELLGSVGEDCYIEPPFRCDYGGQIAIGDRFYANFDCILLDVCPIVIGSDVLFGPRVSIYAATHPVDAAIRDEKLELGAPVTIGDSVWVGGNTVINPGVTIGSGTVIGSGSVVTRDIRSGVVAAGNPCRVLRPVTGEDAVYWQRQKDSRALR